MDKEQQAETVKRWVKTGMSASKEGSTVFYELSGTNYGAESRKRHIPHANRSGTWDHTTYVVTRNGKDIKERYSLKDAKDLAEMLYEDERRKKGWTQ